jgi:hypothetical protein
MSRFRLGETKGFPVSRRDKKVWYAIIFCDQGFSQVEFSSSNDGKKEFLRVINHAKHMGRKYLLLGIWQGEWSTDLFVLEENIIARMIEMEVK